MLDKIGQLQSISERLQTDYINNIYCGKFIMVLGISSLVKAVKLGDLVEWNTASWHLNGLIEVVTVDVTLLFNVPPLWGEGLA